MIGRLKATEEGRRLQFPGWIIRRAQRRFENNWYEIIGSAEIEHRKSKWKLRKITAQLKSTRDGTVTE